MKPPEYPMWMAVLSGDDRTRARQELALGYVTVAQKAEKRRIEAEAQGDKYEASQWRKLAMDSWRMAEEGMYDAPAPCPSSLSYNDAIVHKEEIKHLVTPASDEQEGSGEMRPLQVAAANVGLGVLPPAEQRIAQLRVDGRVTRRAAAEMTGTALMTVDTQIRNYNERWRRLISVGAALSGTAEHT